MLVDDGSLSRHWAAWRGLGASMSERISPAPKDRSPTALARRRWGNIVVGGGGSTPWEGVHPALRADFRVRAGGHQRSSSPSRGAGLGPAGTRASPVDRDQVVTACTGVLAGQVRTDTGLTGVPLEVDAVTGPANWGRRPSWALSVPTPTPASFCLAAASGLAGRRAASTLSWARKSLTRLCPSTSCPHAARVLTCSRSPRHLPQDRQPRRGLRPFGRRWLRGHAEGLGTRG